MLDDGIKNANHAELSCKTQVSWPENIWLEVMMCWLSTVRSGFLGQEPDIFCLTWPNSAIKNFVIWPLSMENFKNFVSTLIAWLIDRCTRNNWKNFFSIIKLFLYFSSQQETNNLPKKCDLFSHFYLQCLFIKTKS